MSETEMAIGTPLENELSPIAHVLATQADRIISVSETYVKDDQGLTRKIEVTLAPRTQGDAA